MAESLTTYTRIKTVQQQDLDDFENAMNSTIAMLEDITSMHNRPVSDLSINSIQTFVVQGFQDAAPTYTGVISYSYDQ